MNISSLYLDHSVFSGHTWSRAVDGESNTEVKVGCKDCIILLQCDTEPQPAAKTKDWSLHSAFKASFVVYVVKLTRLSRKTPPSGCNKQGWYCRCQHLNVLATAQHKDFHKPKTKSGKNVQFHVSQTKCKSPACLSELIPTHLKQMELPNLNGYVLFFHISAG